MRPLSPPPRPASSIETPASYSGSLRPSAPRCRLPHPPTAPRPAPHPLVTDSGLRSCTPRRPAQRQPPAAHHGAALAQYCAQRPPAALRHVPQPRDARPLSTAATSQLALGRCPAPPARPRQRPPAPAHPGSRPATLGRPVRGPPPRAQVSLPEATCRPARSRNRKVTTKVPAARVTPAESRATRRFGRLRVANFWSLFQKVPFSKTSIKTHQSDHKVYHKVTQKCTTK